jgi:WD40 repeat protein
MWLNQLFKKLLSRNKDTLPYGHIVRDTHIERDHIKKTAKLIREIKLEQGYLRSVDWSPDGTRLSLGDESGGVQVLTAEGYRLWRSIEHTDWVYCVVWSPNGRWIASASEDKTIHVYDAISGEIVLRGEAGFRNCGITWSPDSNRLAWYVRNGGSHIVRIFNSATGKPLIDCQGHTSFVWSVSWSPCGKWLASGSDDKTLRIWNPTNGTCLHCLERGDREFISICWSPDGQKLALGSFDMTIQVWNILPWECLMIYKGHTDIVWSVAWSPNGNILATESGKNTLSLLDAEKGTQLLQIDKWGYFGDTLSPIDRLGMFGYFALSFSPHGSLLASLIEDTLHLLDVSDFIQVKKEKVIDTPFQQYISLQAATIGFRPPDVNVKAPPWVPHLPEAEGECLGVLRYTNLIDVPPPSVALFPDGRSIATGHSDGTVRRWNLRTGSILWQGTEKHTNYITDIAVSPDGTRIATVSGDKTIRIWYAQTGQCLGQLKIHAGFWICWSPDRKRLASLEYSSEKQLCTWEVETGECLWVGEGHTEMTSGLDWSADGQFIATGDDKGNLIIWDAVSGQNLRRFNCQNEAIFSLRWSPDNRFLLTGFSDGSVLVVNPFDGSIRFNILGHNDCVFALDWSRDGRFITAGAFKEGKTLRVWDADTGLELKRFTFTENDCFRLAFAPDSAFIVASLKIKEKEDVFRIFDTRDILENKTTESITTAAPPAPSSTKPVSDHLRHLPPALAQMHRLTIYPPLSLLRDLLDLLADRCEVEALKTLMANNRGIQGLRDLHWPNEARQGLAALLLHRLPPSEWKPPQDTTPNQLRDALTTALSWEPMEPQPPAPPISLITQAADMIDDRLLSLLPMLGPGAVAADPGLPLRLLARVKDIPALSITQRRLLGVRISTSGISGQSTGRAPGADRVQVGDIEMGPLLNDWSSLLPSQLAMPPMVQMYRHLRSELLFRAREMAEPPRIRPAVILLDVSPPSFGPIEKITRLAAFTIAQSIRRAGQRVILLTNSDGIKQGQWLLELTHPADLLEIWLQRTLKTIPAAHSLHLARILQAGLQKNDGLEPIILVLSHPWYGAEEDIPQIKDLRGLFVQLPGYPAVPVLAGKCEKWRTIETTQIDELTPILAQLMT